jgi:hypothetical protein
VNLAPISMASHVCAKHFHSDDIQTHERMTLPNGTVILRKQFRPVLTKNAVPSIFGNEPEVLPESQPVEETVATQPRDPPQPPPPVPSDPRGLIPVPMDISGSSLEVSVDVHMSSDGTPQSPVETAS